MSSKIQQLKANVTHAAKDATQGARKLINDGRQIAQKVIKDVTGTSLRQASSRVRHRHARQDTGVPAPSGRKHDSVIRDRQEFIGHLNGSTTLSIQTLDLNPLNSTLFPIGASEAATWEMYRFTKLQLVLVSTAGSVSSTAALGTMGVGMTYDPNDPLLTTEAQMLSYDGGKSFKAWPIDARGKREDGELVVDIDINAGPFVWRYINHDSSAPLSSAGTYYCWASANPTTNGIALQYIRYTIEFKKSRTPASLSTSLSSTQCIDVTVASGTSVFSMFPTGSTDTNYSSTGPSYVTLAKSDSADSLNFTQIGFYHVVWNNQSDHSTVAGNVDAVTVGGAASLLVPTGADNYLTNNVLAVGSTSEPGPAQVSGCVWVIVPALPAGISAPVMASLSDGDCNGTITITKYSTAQTYAPITPPGVTKLTADERKLLSRLLELSTPAATCGAACKSTKDEQAPPQQPGDTKKFGSRKL